MGVPVSGSLSRVTVEEVPSRGLVGPAGKVGLSGVAAMAMAMSDRAVAVAEIGAASRGEPVTCGKGCADCCRELIPVSPAEAFFLRDLVISLPEERRMGLETRFQATGVRLREAYEQGRFPFHDPGAYFSLGIPCPFLSDEACTIHPHRPLACREHLAVSPAVHCGSFPNHSIRVLPIQGSMGEALSNLCAEILGRPPERITLLSALEWAESHAEYGFREWDAGRIAEALVFHLEQVS